MTRHRVTMTIDQTDDHPDEVFHDADELREFLLDGMARRNTTMVQFGLAGFDIDVDSVEIETIKEEDG